MKNKYIISLGLIIMTINTVKAQWLTFDHFEYVYTPQSSQIEGIVWDPLTSDQYSAAMSTANSFSNISIVGNPTSEYNCHSWAWHLSEGNSNKVWINNEDDNGLPNLSKYWNDGSFIKVSSSNDARNIHYYDGNHSADKYSSTHYISKWGYGCLVIHTPDNVPSIYLGGKNYYEKFMMDGPRYVCNGSNASFITPDYANCTFNWTYDTSLLNLVSGQGTKNFTVTPKSSSVSGYAWVNLSLTINSPVNKTFSISKYIGVNMPLSEDLSFSLYTNTGTPVSYMCANRHYHIYLNNNSGCSLSNYAWSVPAAWSINYTSGNMISVYTNSLPGGMVEVNATTCCGVYTKVKTGYLASGYCGGYYAMSLSPNPSNGEATLSVEPTSEDIVFDENAEWEVEIFDQTQGLKEQKTKLKGKELKIQTTGWKTGIYFVRVKYKDEYLQGKLIVN